MLYQILLGDAVVNVSDGGHEERQRDSVCCVALTVTVSALGCVETTVK